MLRVNRGGQPGLAALLAMSPRHRWLDRWPEHIFIEMPNLHGETSSPILGDVLARPRRTGLFVVSAHFPATSHRC